MEAYLVQHAHALSEEQDPERPLSAEGRRTTTRMAAYLAAAGARMINPPVVELLHSGKLRARQTAEILANVLCPHVTASAVKSLQPDADPRLIHHELESRREEDTALLLVGHLPHLARLAGLLLTGEAEKSPVSFVNAAVLRLGFHRGNWAVDWYVTPACVP